MDAVLEFCKDNDLDPSTIGSMVSKSLKEKIKAEAVNLKLLKNSSAASQGKLPV